MSSDGNKASMDPAESGAGVGAAADSSEARDQELDDLLDSALEDFDAPPKVPSSEAKPVPENAEDVDKLLEGIWNEDVMKEAMSQFEKSMKTLFAADGNEPDEGMAEQLSKEFCKMAEETVKTVIDGTEEKADFNTAIKQTLKNLADNSKNFQGGVDNPEELMAMLSNLDMGQDAEGEVPSDIFSCCNKIMQLFLSKETLYQPLKELCDKYPVWLEENKSKLPKDEYEKYESQFGLMKQVCDEFENMNDTDTADVKSEKFKNILKLMQKMQNFGYPPEELIGDSTVNYQLGEEMLSNLLPGGAGAGVPSDCSLM